MRLLQKLLVLLALTLAACGGGGGDDEAVEGGDDSTTTLAAAGPEAGDAAPDATAPGAETTVAAAGTQTTAAGGPAPTNPAGKPAAAVGARPGTYRYKVSGTATGGTPPTTRPHEGTSTLVVDPASGRDQRAVQTSQEGQGSEVVTRYDGDTTYLVSLSLKGQFQKDFKPEQPVLAMRRSAKTGDKWSWDLKSTDGTTTMHDDTEVLGREDVTIGGRKVSTIKARHKIRIVTSFNGAPFTIDIVRTGWEALDLFLTVKEHTVTDVPGFVHDESTSTLESLDPS